MGLFDFILDPLFGDPEEDAPKYQAPPAYQPLALPAGSTELPTVQGDNLSSLGGLFSDLLNQYRTTGSATAPGVEQAMMDEARRGVQYDTGQASNQIAENMNRMNLLNSTAHGTAQALNQQSGLRNLLDAQSRVLQQRQANQQNLMQFGSGLAPIFTQRAQAQLAPKQWGYEQQNRQNEFGYNASVGNAENQYQSQLNPYQAKQNRNTAFMGALAGLAGRGTFGGLGGSAATSVKPIYPKNGRPW